MSKAEARKKQKEAALVRDQKEAAKQGITVAKLRENRKDKNTAIVVGIASLIPAVRGANLATRGITSGYKYLKGLFKAKPKELTKTQISKIGNAVKKMEKNEPKLKLLEAPKAKGTSVLKPGTSIKPDRVLKETRGMKTVKGTDRSVGKKQITKKTPKKDLGKQVPRAAATVATLATIGSSMKGDKVGPKGAAAETMTDKQKEKVKKDFGMGRVDDFAKSRVRRTDDQEGGTAPIAMKSKRKDPEIKKPKRKEKVKKEELKKVVKKKRSNIKGSSSYDAQFTYDELKKRGGKKFAEARMSKENLAKVTKRRMGGMIRKPKTGHTDYRAGGMFYGK